VVLDTRPERETGEALPGTVCKHGHAATHSGDLPPGALTITRRVFRDGRESWLLDGASAGPSDVQAALSASGVGSPPVTVIRQGELERLLFLDPLDRRHVIETAAGIDALAGDLRRLIDRRAALLLRREHMEGALEAAGAQRDRLLLEADALRRAVVLEAELYRVRAAAVRAAFAGVENPAGPLLSEPAHGAPIEHLLHLLGLPTDGDALAGEDRADLRTRLEALQSDRETLGPVNSRALSDLEGLEEETADLETRLNAIEQELRAIAREVAERTQAAAAAFAAAHRRVERRFRDYYALLAPGGEAALPLVPIASTDTAATAEAETTARSATGVDVVARPPGKVLDRVSSLSGGERSLAALSLALAVFEEYPSPLFVLDEVEPALDDANIRRVQAVLDRVADRRQILLVSHQQRAKETGDVVFGVERNLDGASQVKYRYEPRTRKLDIFRRTWAADHLRRYPLGHRTAHADSPESIGAAGSPTQAALAKSTPGPGAGPSRYRPRYFHEDGTFRGIWDAMGNALGETAPADAAGGTRNDATGGSSLDAEDSPSRTAADGSMAGTQEDDGGRATRDSDAEEGGPPPVKPCC
jgi:chromosome segregation ATPase